MIVISTILFLIHSDASINKNTTLHSNKIHWTEISIFEEKQWWEYFWFILRSIGIKPKLFTSWTRSTKSRKVYKFRLLGRGGGRVVSVLAFHSDDLSSNPAGANSFIEIINRTNKNYRKMHPDLPETCTKLIDQSCKTFTIVIYNSRSLT